MQVGFIGLGHMGKHMIVERDKQEALRRGWGAWSMDVFVRLQEERAGVVLEYAEVEETVR